MFLLLCVCRVALQSGHFFHEVNKLREKIIYSNVVHSGICCQHMFAYIFWTYCFPLKQLRTLRGYLGPVMRPKNKNRFSLNNISLLE